MTVLPISVNFVVSIPCHNIPLVLPISRENKGFKKLSFWANLKIGVSLSLEYGANHIFILCNSLDIYISAICIY